MRSAVVASMFVLLWPGVTIAQNPASDPSQQNLRSARKSDLMARSEMQSPKSIPIVKWLRFREIPVNGPGDRCPDNRLPENVQDAQMPAAPAIQVEKPLEQGMVIGTPDRP